MNCRFLAAQLVNLILLAFLTTFLLFSPAGAAEQSQFHTIQVGSYSQEPPAARVYHSLAETLAPGQRDHLRIEKVGAYYTVRLGRFATWPEAARFLGAAGGPLAGAFILQAYIKPERISLLYVPVASAETPVFAEVTGTAAEIPETPAAAGSPAAEESAAEVAAEPVASVEKTSQRMIQPPGEAAIAPEERVPVLAAGEDAWHVKGSADATDEKLAGAAFEVAQQEEAAAAIADREAGMAEPEAREEAGDELDKSRPFETLGQPTGIYPVRVVSIITKTMFGDKMSFPSVIHYDPVMKEIYLISGGGANPSSKIMIYGPDYFPIAALGKGRGVINPSGLTVDAEGNIYISQQYSNDLDGFQVAPHIQVLNAAFFSVKDIFFDSIPGLQGEFTPANLALGSEHESLYVSGHLTKGVLVLDKDGNFKRWLVPRIISGAKEDVGSSPDDPNGQNVSDVVVDRNGRIYLVCDPAGRIFVLDRNEEFLFAFGVKGGSTGKLSRPRSLAVDEARQAIYVVDYMRHAVNVYNYQGKYLFEVGGRGDDPGWFNFPTHIAVDHVGNLIVADYFNHRVQVLLVP